MLLLALAPLAADVTQCVCDPAKPETMQARECSLCREAEKQPNGTKVFFLKDINPRKPNRWLALPRRHLPAQHSLAALTPAERTGLWRAAIDRAREQWGDRWALAINGDRVRTQCHTHLHIGRLIEGVETPNFVDVDGPEHIPVPEDGTGLWVYPVGGRLRVHLGEQLTETVLLR